ncbi:hypothetical protein FCR2A7T_27450 [Flavobacterium cauense R2A-7]|uniref:hypothetical protein n=1 Tax=Flavobacterium cauense TaxID=510946 RepID=UPI0003C59DA1|nr:hypothetical protein [Flavobacterium cauense]ESU18639.1 hypothetical protein FCR2A7T_27450 [Flavobacterium cauense R2A-7]KGO78593.1 hypothetical protein Q762_15105 [Flavobacterium cauense R2A-7]
MNFNIKLLIYLVFGFIVSTIIGTLTHEFGHYLIAETLGYDATINYASTSFSNDKEFVDNDYFWVTLGGPLQTIITGTIGFIFLYVNKKSFEKSDKLNFKQWLIIFVSLFWLRQLANLFMGLIGFLKRGHISTRSDESKLDLFLNLKTGTTLSLTAFLAAIILSIILYKFIPRKQLFTFLISGIVGGISGYYLWLIAFGKILMS